MKNTVFISYSQKDKDRVSLFASIMASNGFEIWMDVKNIHLGERIVSAISEGLNQADIYMVFISYNSSQSTWVEEELNIALKRNIENRKPQIIPVLLDDCEIPLALGGRVFLDARESIQKAIMQLNKEFSNNKEGGGCVFKTADKPILSGVIFSLSKKTDVSIGPFWDGLTSEDLLGDREKIKKLLRKRANGILLNFIPLCDFDLQAQIPKFKNGSYDEIVEKVPGETTASICEKVTVATMVFNPDMRKIEELVKNKLDKLLVTSLTYIYSLPFQREDFDKSCMQKLQNNYSIISYDFEDGAMIEYDSNFFVGVKCTPEQIQIKLQTEYDFYFSQKAAEFSTDRFIEWLVK